MDWMQSYEEFERRALALSPADMISLSDEELGDVLRARVFHTVETEYHYDYALALSGLTDAARTALILYTLNDEIQNGGLCQYFVNSTSEYSA